MKHKYLTGFGLLLCVFLLFLSACSQQDDSASDQASIEPEVATSTPDQSTTDTDKTVDAATEQPAEKPAETAQVASPATVTPGTADNATSTEEQDMSEHEAELALAKQSGCLACHAVDKKVVGPAWRDVSKRYKEDPDAKTKLIAKVSKGGKGNWTEVVGAAAMPPYSPRVSDQNIEKLVDFVLSLEK